jgi:hypothetical protein
LRFPKGVARRSARLVFAAWLVARRVTVTCVRRKIRNHVVVRTPRVERGGRRTTVYAKYPKKAPKGTLMAHAGRARRNTEPRCDHDPSATLVIGSSSLSH